MLDRLRSAAIRIGYQIDRANDVGCTGLPFGQSDTHVRWQLDYPAAQNVPSLKSDMHISYRPTPELMSTPHLDSRVGWSCLPSDVAHRSLCVRPNEGPWRCLAPHTCGHDALNTTSVKKTCTILACGPARNSTRGNILWRSSCFLTVWQQQSCNTRQLPLWATSEGERKR